MASASARTPQLVLHLHSRAVPRHERLRLPSSPRLVAFLQSAAQVGLDAPLAVRLALERALILLDGQELRLDVERVRQALCQVAAEARASQPLSATQAEYVRKLYRGGPPATVAIGDGLSVSIPDDLLTRVRDAVPETALHSEAVDEMLAWERAARLEGRTMAEWALKTLAGLLRRSSR